MRKPGWPLIFVLLAVGLGVLAAVTTADTAAAPWIKRGIGVALILIGGMIFLSRDEAVNRGYSQLFGAGYVFFGVSQFIPSGRWRTAVAVLALGCMITAFIRRRRRLAAARS